MDLPERFNAAAFFVDRHVAEGRGGRTAFRFAGRSLTYGEVADRVDRAAGLFAAHGVEIEDRVLLALDDTPGFAAAFWGVVKLGAVAVPLNTLMAPAECAFLLDDSRAKVAVGEPHLAETFCALRERGPWLRAVVTPADLEAARAARARVGGASVLVAERLTPERAFEVIAAERPTIFFAVPTLYARMLQVDAAERRWDLSSLRYCVSSGETLPPAIFEGWRERFGLELVEVVGSTEALHDFIANRPGKARAGTAGQMVPGFEARLVDDAGQPVAFGAVGHLLIKGETTAPCYWNRLARTRTTMLGDWLRTGDMFSRDEEGWFTFAGRADDMLKVGGMWVSPAEVEAHLVEHPAVLEAGVVGREDEDGLTKVHAAVVLKDAGAPSDPLREELRRFVKERAAGYKVPRWIEFVPDLPKTATGKIQRFRLRIRA